MGWKKCVFGPFEALEGRFCEEAREIQNSLSPVWVLVGSNLLRERLNRILASVQKTGWFNIEWMTFLDLARALAWRSLSAEGRVGVLPGAEPVLMRRAWDAVQEDLSFLKDLGDMPRAMDLLVSTWSDLQEAGLTEFSGLARFGKKGKDLGLILSQMQDELIAVCAYTRQDIFRRATQEAKFLSNVQSPQALLVYGFYDLQPLQQDLLEAIAARIPVQIYLPTFSGPGASFGQETRAWLMERTWEQTLPVRCESRDSEFLHRLKSGSSDIPPLSSQDRSFRILSAPQRSQEVREILRQMLALMERDGIRPHEMAILLRQPRAYQGLLADEVASLQSQGLSLPFRFVPGLPLMETRPARSVAWLVALARGNLPRVDLMAFARYAPLKLGEPARERLSLWDSLSLKATISSGVEQWETGLDHLHTALEAAREEADALGSTSEILNVEMQALTELSEWFKHFHSIWSVMKKEGPWSDLAISLSQAAHELFEPSPALDLVLSKVLDLGGMDRFDGRTTLAGFSDVLQSVLLSSEIPQSVRVGEGILVSSLMDARGLRFRVVFIPGLVEGEFPSMSGQDPFLLDEERVRLQSASGTTIRMPLRSARKEEEEALFELGLQAATERLVLSHPRFQDSGSRPLMPSPFLLRMARKASGSEVRSSGLEWLHCVQRCPSSCPDPLDPDRALTLRERDRSCLRFGQPKEKSQAFGFLKRESLGSSLTLLQKRYGDEAWTEYDGILTGPPHAFRPQRAISPSQLETYASCPFSYFLTYLLGIEETERSGDLWPSPLDRGLLVHKVLEMVLRASISEESRVQGWTASEVQSRLIQAAQEISTGLSGQRLVNPGAWTLCQSEVVDALRHEILTSIQSADPYVPKKLEVSFGSPGGYPAVSIDTEHGTVRLRGRADRLDEGPDGTFRVIDYKTGRKTSGGCDVASGRCLQLPVYLMAGAAILKRNLSDGEAMFLYVGSSSSGRAGILGQDWPSVEPDMRRAISLILSFIDQGIFPALPEPQCDRGCIFRKTCLSRDTVFERKRRDPRIQALLSLGDPEEEDS